MGICFFGTIFINKLYIWHLDHVDQSRSVSFSVWFILEVFYLCFWYLHIVFRDGVSESQFNQVLNIELDQIIEVLWTDHCALQICPPLGNDVNFCFLVRHASFSMRAGTQNLWWLLLRRTTIPNSFSLLPLTMFLLVGRHKHTN